MFMAPGTLELCLLWPFSLGGDDDKPWTAESTLVSGSDMVERTCTRLRGGVLAA